MQTPKPVYKQIFKMVINGHSLYNGSVSQMINKRTQSPILKTGRMIKLKREFFPKGSFKRVLFEY